MRLAGRHQPAAMHMYARMRFGRAYARPVPPRPVDRVTDYSLEAQKKCAQSHVVFRSERTICMCMST